MRARAALLPLGAAALTLLVWTLPFQRLLPWTDPGITDVPVYQAIADGLARGDLPYRDLPLEYPPGAAVVFWAAGLLPGDYAGAFGALMMLVLAAGAAGAVVAARALGLGRPRQVAAGVATALTPLLLGNLVETRFDLVLSALLAWLVAAAASERWRWMWTLFALAVLVKLVPLVLLPVLVLWQAHRVSGRAALRGAAAGLAGVAVPLAAIAVVAPSGLWRMFRYHLDRPPQIESLASSYMLALHNLVGVRVRVEDSFGSQGLPGDGVAVVAAIATAAVVVAVLAVAVTFRLGLGRARRGGDLHLLAAATAATLAAVLAGGKVLSPQFMCWLVPLGFLVGGRYGRLAFAATAGALVLTQTWFPGRYWDLVALHEGPIWLLVSRNALLIALVAMCWPRVTTPGPPPSAPLPGRDAARAAPERAVAARFLVD